VTSNGIASDAGARERPGMTTAERTDVRNSEALVSLHSDRLRYVSTWGKWLRWTDNRWQLDESCAVQEAAKDTARALYDEAIEEARLARGDKDAMAHAQASLAWATKSQGAPRVAAMVTLARSSPSIAVKHDQLDADCWALNVSNGTIDLRSGDLRSHCRDNLITKLAPVVFDPSAACPTWDAFLSRAMGNDVESVHYLARMVGYALTGDVREHVLAFFFGGGANGKSTFLSTLHAMLGDYATPAPRGLLFRAHGERHPTELASLHGRRFVTCSEIEDGQAFDEALIKDLTGGDPIECRRMREDFWCYQPTHKLFLAGNHRPAVRGDDEGIWRRMRLVPWTVTIPEGERDPSLPDKFRAELPGILAWAVRGCLDWQRRGLDATEAVKRATADYREENDTLGEFFRLRLIFEAGATIVRKELREAYETHCTDNGAEPFGARRFSSRLRERGVTKTGVRRGMHVLDGWRGVRLATDAERAASTAWGADRRDVGTCSEQFLYQRQTPAHEAANRKSVTTSPNVTTGNTEGRDTSGEAPAPLCPFPEIGASNAESGARQESWPARKAPCARCRGLGVVRESLSLDDPGMPSPYVYCPCGHLPSSTGQRLLAEQYRQRVRLEELRKEGLPDGGDAAPAADRPKVGCER
jgi:putative DNA primase/helicase